MVKNYWFKKFAKFKKIYMSILKLNSISGLPESLISGKNAALEDCLSENEVKWNSKNYQNVVAL